MTVLYIPAIVALLVGTGAIYMALIKPFPVHWLYYHYFLRKPVVWSIFGASLLWVAWLAVDSASVPWSTLTPLAMMALAIVLTYRMHQENAFPAVDFPAMAEDPLRLPLKRSRIARTRSSSPSSSKVASPRPIHWTT